MIASSFGALLGESEYAFRSAVGFLNSETVVQEVMNASWGEQ